LISNAKTGDYSTRDISHVVKLKYAKQHGQAGFIFTLGGAAPVEQKRAAEMKTRFATYFRSRCAEKTGTRP